MSNRANIAYHITDQIPSSIKDSNTNHRIVGKVYEDEILITTAEILALYTTPKVLVAAPGAGKVLQFISAVGFLDFNTAAYTTRGILTVKCHTTAVSDPCAAAALVQQADDCYEEINKLSTEVELVVNKPLNLYCDTGNPVVGDSPIRMKVMYRVLDFN